MLPIKPFKFTDSKYFYIDEIGWHLKEDAPEELKREFANFQEKFNSIRTGDIEEEK